MVFSYRLITQVIKDEPEITITSSKIITVKRENKEYKADIELSKLFKY